MLVVGGKAPRDGPHIAPSVEALVVGKKAPALGLQVAAVAVEFPGRPVPPALAGMNRMLPLDHG